MFFSVLIVACSCIVPSASAAYDDYVGFHGLSSINSKRYAAVQGYIYQARVLWHYDSNNLYVAWIGSDSPITVSENKPSSPFFQVSAGSVYYSYMLDVRTGVYKASTFSENSASAQRMSLSTLDYVEANYAMNQSGFSAPFYRIGPSESDVPVGDPWMAGGVTQARILSPRDGFSQQGVKTVVTRVYFCIPFDGKKGNIKYAVDGFDPDKSRVQSLELNAIENGTKVEGILVCEGIVKNWNTEQVIRARITDHAGKVWSTSECRVTCYEDFLDEDGDGLDDRTGQIEWVGGSGDPTDPRPDNPSGGAGFDDFPSMLSGIMGSISSFVSFLQDFSRFIPMPIFSILAVGVGMVVILRIAGR